MRYDSSIVSGEKFTDRVLSNNNPITQKIVSILREFDYELFVHDNNSLDLSKPIFTIILTIHNANITYVKKSLHSVFSQSYENTEIILINNGAQGAVNELIWDNFRSHSNSKLIHLTQNLYDPNPEPLKDPLPNLWNAGLFCSQGNFVYFLAYDDFLGSDYAERLVALYEANKACVTASPLVLSVNEKDEVNVGISKVFENRNQRGRYTSGIELARSYMNNENKIVFPGGMLSFKSELVISSGGFDNMSDLSQLFRFAIHGQSGFDPDAKLFWRHHPVQTNKFQTQMGLVYYKVFKKYSDFYNLKQLHEKIAGSEFANEFQHYTNKFSEEQSLNAFRGSYRMGFVSGLKALARIFVECPPRMCFKAMWYLCLDFPRNLYYNHVYYILRTIYKRLFRYREIKK